ARRPALAACGVAGDGGAANPPPSRSYGVGDLAPFGGTGGAGVETGRRRRAARGALREKGRSPGAAAGAATRAARSICRARAQSGAACAEGGPPASRQSPQPSADAAARRAAQLRRAHGTERL